MNELELPPQRLSASEHEQQQEPQASMSLSSLMMNSSNSSTDGRPQQHNLLALRIKAVRPEIINLLSFLGVLSKLVHRRQAGSIATTIGTSIFYWLGIVIVVIDVYFIYCQWNLRHSNALPSWMMAPIRSTVVQPLMQAVRHRQQYNNSFAHASLSSLATVGTMEDVLSDLPQAVWVLFYLMIWAEEPVSWIAVICALNSAISIVEGFLRTIHTTTTSPRQHHRSVLYAASRMEDPLGLEEDDNDDDEKSPYNPMVSA